MVPKSGNDLVTKHQQETETAEWIVTAAIIFIWRESNNLLSFVVELFQLQNINKYLPSLDRQGQFLTSVANAAVPFFLNLPGKYRQSQKWLTKWLHNP